MVIMHEWCIGLKEHSGEITGTLLVRLFFHQLEFFCLVGTLVEGFGVLFWHLWIGKARKPGPASGETAVEVFNVGAG